MCARERVPFYGVVDVAERDCSSYEIKGPGLATALQLQFRFFKVISLYSGVPHDPAPYCTVYYQPWYTAVTMPTIADSGFRLTALFVKYSWPSRIEIKLHARTCDISPTTFYDFRVQLPFPVS